MNKLKSGGLSLIILGNILYLVYIYFSGKETSTFSEFTSGLLLGMSIGINLIGIILTAMYMSKQDKKIKC